jgi:hypothetical protein
VLEQASDFVEDLHLAEVTSVDFEVLDLPEETPWDPEDPDGSDDPDAAA